MPRQRKRSPQWTAREVKVYSLFQTMGAIELHLDGDHIDNGRLICSQKDYMSILDFGYSLAKTKGLQFINCIKPQ